ncbi:SCF ubiquitin ligase complex subunit UFO1 Ecym_1384 [Eremothecium cymbalariae DBVPG|uniref:F-box domain-containing protein n=1 Tax=Eremothecium cymbalariae (strain CBS 270.75 / DBVPG 7215 / KCTC 17166 / NRRL Y-17582) TaxID=931890 RepID=G8JNF1_ERECY|nr:hypothetical protein Ecym_1384 [Eremothecium cymbalariae DBVPG\
MSDVQSLLQLPSEILVHIFSHLDEQDFLVLKQISQKFADIIDDEELWKNLLLRRIHTKYFPSYSRSNKYSIEYVERNSALKKWRNKRAIQTKYTISYDQRQVPPGSLVNSGEQRVIFEYPRCACYSEGVVTFLQLQAKRRKDRLSHVQCPTPSGCSVMHFNINAVVFGRYDGKVFGKLLTNKTYLSPVLEFDSRHESAVTAIATAAFEGSSDDWVVSGSDEGELIWWCNTKMYSRLRFSNRKILHIFIHKKTTVAIDKTHIHVVENMHEPYSIELEDILGISFDDIRSQKVDFGARLLLLAGIQDIYVVSIDPHKDIGSVRNIKLEHSIEEIVLDDATSRKEQNPSNIAGGDGCYAAVLTSDNSVMVLNIRSPGLGLNPQIKLSFHERLHICHISNLILACAFSGMVALYDASTGTEIRVIKRTDKYPEFLNIADGQLLIQSGHMLNYYQYVSSETLHRKTSSRRSDKSNKWNEQLKAQLSIYDEEERLKREKLDAEERLRRNFVGDVEDEELQLKIALLESESTELHHQDTFDEELQQALEESRKLHAVSNINIGAEEEDEELVRILEQSRLETDATLKNPLSESTNNSTQTSSSSD